MAEDHKVHDGKKPEKVEETKVVEPKAEKKKVEVKKGEKKTEAVVNGNDLAIGRKHAVALSNFIRGKDIDVAIKMLEDVIKYKRAVPMRGEIPHRKGMMSGRYPIKGAKIYIALLKSLKANAMVNELELEKYKLFIMPNRAARPYKRYGQGRFKRSHVTIKLISRQKQTKEKKK